MISGVFLLALAFLAGAYSRYLSGAQNAAFYAKGSGNVRPYIRRWVENLHRLETPQWYAQAAQLSILVCAYALERGASWWEAALAGTCFALGASAFASPFYQGVINHSVGRPFVDRNENPKSEFAFVLFGRVYSLWWPRPWRGRFRLVAPIIGVGYFLLSIYFIFQ